MPATTNFVGMHTQKQGWYLSWLLVFPQQRWGRGQCQQQCTFWACTPGDRRCYRAHVQVDNSWGGIHSSSFPSGSSPVPPTSHHSLGLDLGASTSTTGEQTLPLIGLWQPQSKEEALPNIQCRLWSPQHQSHPLSRGEGPAHPEERHGRHPYQKQPLHQKY